MYIEIRFKFPKGSLFDSFQGTARKFVSLACRDLSMPAFFGKREDGKERQEVYQEHGPKGFTPYFSAPPLVSFGRGPGMIRITGLGPEGCALVREAAPTVQTALIRYAGTPVTFECLEGRCGLKYKGDHLTAYAIPRLIVAKKPKAMDQFLHHGEKGQWAPLHEVRERVARVIMGGLLSQARFLDQALGWDSTGMENLLRLHDSALPDLAEGRPVPIEIKPGILATGFRDILVGLPFKLTGPWNVGYLRTEGYGRLHVMRGQA